MIISVKAIKSRQPLDKKIMARFFIFLVLLIAFLLGWIVGCVHLFSPIPLASAMLLFFFGLVFSKMAREVYSPNYSQISTKLIRIRIEKPTSVAVEDNVFLMS